MAIAHATATACARVRMPEGRGMTPTEVRLGLRRNGYHPLLRNDKNRNLPNQAYVLGRGGGP